MSLYLTVSHVINESMQKSKHRIKRLCTDMVNDRNIQFPIFLHNENLTESIRHVGRPIGEYMNNGREICKDFNIFVIF